MQRLLMLAAMASLLVSAGVSTAMAQDGFRSPTGNIHCQFFTSDGESVLRCDLRQISKQSIPRPADCELDFGRAFEISTRATRGTPLCYGDTVQDNRLPMLAYDQTWRRGDLVCVAQRTGVTCKNADGHGFMLSQALQRVF